MINLLSQKNTIVRRKSDLMFCAGTNLYYVMRSGLLVLLISMLILIFSFSFVSASRIAKPPNFLTLNTGLLAWWTFDGPDIAWNVVGPLSVGTVTDKTGLGNSALYVNMDRDDATTIGKIGQGVSFDGVDDLASSTISSGLSSSFTVSLWVKPEATITSGTMIANSQVASYGNYWFGISGSESPQTHYRVGLYDGTANPYIDSGATYTLGKWDHVVMVRDVVADTISVYVNGVFDTQTTDTTTSVPTYSDFYMGREHTPDRPFNGDVDEVRLFSRALSAVEIGQLYNIGGGGGGSVGASVTDKNNPLNKGLLAYWTFDGKNLLTGSVLDVTGNQNSGSMVNMATSTSRVSGKIGQGLLFDGTDDSVIATDTGAMGPMTISVWIKPKTLNTFDMIVSKDNTGLTNAEFYLSGWTGNTIGWSGGFGGSWTGGGWDTVLKMDRWYHLAWVYDGSTHRLYIDGVQESTTYADSGATAGGQKVMLGARKFTAPELFFDGQMDDTRIYSRALSANEVSQVYNLGIAKIATSITTLDDSLSSGLVGHWRFDGKDMLTGTVKDVSGFNNHGSAFGLSTSTMYASGKLGQSLYFQGLNTTGMFVEDSSSLDLTNFTISMWFMRKGNGTTGGFGGCASNGVEFLTAKGLGGGDNSGIDSSWALGVVQGTSKLIACFEGATGVDYILSQGSTTIQNNVWYHVVLTHTAESTVVYLNGVSDSSTGTTADPANNNIRIGIGYGTEGAASTPDGAFNGLIDDFRIYNRALSSEEVSKLYNLGL